jgi:uncharacterized membrane protein
VIVSAPVEEVYERWSYFDRFNEFMGNVKSVEMTGERSSHWVVKGPLGSSVEFDAETTMMEPNKRIAWNSRDGGDVKTSGQVSFNELGNNQTEVHVILKYDPPAGVAGDLVAKVFSNPQKQLEEDMARFKQLVNHKNYATG